MLRNLLLIVILSFVVKISLAQTISVASFRLLETDLDARQNFPKKDQNGNLCAIIKIVTTEKGFGFDNGTLGITDIQPKQGEIWVWVPFGTKKMTISHDKLGILRDYIINEKVEQGRVYEMVITTGKVITTIEEVPTSQYLTIKSEPSGAIVYIDEEQQTKTTPFSKRLPLGKHTYLIELADYHNEAGSVELKAENNAEIIVSLKPAFGFAYINTTPEDDATIFIDNKPINGTTPYKTSSLSSGQHTVKILKPLYKPTQQTIIISDGNTTNVNLVMQPDFATVYISTHPVADIFINGVYKENGKWIGRLEPGSYVFEAILDRYSKDFKNVDLVTGQKIELTLSPQPLTGNLDINSDPIDAIITINGETTINEKKCAVTPNTFYKLLVGSYKISLSKTGYGTIIKDVLITENKTTEVFEILPITKIVTITSIPNGSKLYIDDKDVGNTPYTGSLRFGKHKIKVDNVGTVSENIINVRQDSSSNWTIKVKKIEKENTGYSINGLKDW